MGTPNHDLRQVLRILHHNKTKPNIKEEGEGEFC